MDTGGIIGSVIGIFILIVFGFIFFLPSSIFSSVIFQLNGLSTGLFNSDLCGLDDLITEAVDEIGDEFTSLGDSIANTATQAGDSVANTATQAADSVAHAFGF